MTAWIRYLLYGSLAGLAIFGSWQTWNVVATSRYHDAVERFAAAGLPTTMRDLLPPAVPPEMNAAPLYLRAMALAKPLPDIRGPVSPPLSKEMREAVAAANEALEIFRKAAALPGCSFPRDASGWPDSSVRISDLVKLGRLLAARAAMRAEEGDAASALDDLKTLFRASRALRDEPTLLPQIVRLTICGLGLDALKAIFPRAPSAAEAFRRVEPDDLRGGFARGLRCEAAHFVENSTQGWPDLEMKTLSWKDPIDVLFRFRAVTRPYLKSLEGAEVDFMRQLLSAIEKPYPETIPLASKLEADARRSGGLLPIFVAGYRGWLEREAKSVSRMEAARVAALLMDHQRKKGTLPASLADIESAESVLDPLSGEPFVLARRGRGLFLESPDDPSVSWKIE